MAGGSVELQGVGAATVPAELVQALVGRAPGGSESGRDAQDPRGAAVLALQAAVVWKGHGCSLCCWGGAE